MMHRFTLQGALLSALCLIGLTGCFELPNECEQSASCRASYGPTFYCADDGICDQYTPAQYTAAPCNFETVGPVFEKDTINVGVILALDKNADFFGLIEPIAKAIKLAQNDVNQGDGINGKKMGVIFCNTNGKNEQAEQAAKHLASIGIQAIIGPDFSSYTTEVVNSVLVPNGVLAISPSATAPSLSGLNDQDLFWRTVASDKIQSVVLAQLVDHVVNNVVPKKGGTPKVAMLVRENDTYANGLSAGIIETLPTSFTSAETFLTTNYPNAGLNQGDDYSAVAIKVSEFNPDVVLIWGLTEVWDIAQQLDTLMESDNNRTDTIYIVADGGKDTVKAQIAGQRRPSLSGRIWGTAPRSLSADEYAPYKSFQVRWRSANNTEAEMHPFITNAYDAVYLIAFAAAGAQELTGTALAKVMRRLTDPTGVKVTANQQEFNKGVTTITNGGKIDFSGASGPIEFDENGDPKSTNIALWCLKGTSIEEKGDLLRAGQDDFTPQNCDYNPTPLPDL